MDPVALLLLENIKRVPAVFPQGLGVYGELKQGPALLVVKVEGQLPKGADCLAFFSSKTAAITKPPRAARIKQTFAPLRRLF